MAEVDDARRLRAQTFAREIWFAEYGADIAAPTWLTQALFAFADAEAERLRETLVDADRHWRASGNVEE